MRMFKGKQNNSASGFREQGFTMAEMLVSFSLFLTVLFFMPLGMNMLLGNGILAKDLQRMEWEVFVSQAKKEIRMCDEILEAGSVLKLQKNGQLIKYEMYGSNLRRTVNGEGHELILREVKTAAFSPVRQGVRITVQDTFGRPYSVIIYQLIKGTDTNDSQ